MDHHALIQGINYILYTVNLEPHQFGGNDLQLVFPSDGPYMLRMKSSVSLKERGIDLL